MSVAWYVRSRVARLALAGSLVSAVTALAVAPVVAADSITVTTPYPAVAVAPGASVNLDVSVTTTNGGRVNLNVTGTPTDWTATLRGSSYAIDSVDTTPRTAVKVSLDVTVPAAATGGTTHLNVVARQGSAVTTLPIDIRVEPNVAGSISMTTDTPSLKGASDASFKFTLTLKNDTPDQQTFTVASTGPDGWTVDTQVGSEAQAASVVVQAGATSPVTVTAKPPADAAGGKYPIAVDAKAGTQTAHSDLSVEVTGSYNISLSTVDGRLNTNASAGNPSDLTLVLTNSGTSDVQGAAMSATAPTGWTVTFEPTSVDVPAGKTAQTVAHMTPSGDAIAGDYVTTFKATASTATASADVRVTVETSLLWGAVGIAIIALVLIGLLWIFRQYGRR